MNRSRLLILFAFLATPALAQDPAGAPVASEIEVVDASQIVVSVMEGPINVAGSSGG